MESLTAEESAAAAPPAAGDDLSAIAWVQEELRRSFDAANKALRRFLKDAEAVTGSDLDAVDPGVLRTARAQIHQGVGALELVGLPAAAIVLRASETAIQRAVTKPQWLTPELVSDIERASFALLDYLSRLLAGKQVSPLALFPQYRAVQEAVEAERVHPADLWAMDWRWREIVADPEVMARSADAETRAQIEGHLLHLMRGTQALTAAARMSEICAGLAAGSSHPQVRTFWSLAAGVFEAQHHGLLPFDVFTKRVASRLLAQFRLLHRGDSDVAERLARDVLFFCAQAAPPGRGVHLPRLAAVRSAYGLAEQAPTDYSLSVLGRFDPAIIAHARKRVVSAKEAWSATAGGELHRLHGLAEQFALVGDSLRKLFPFGESFAAELQAAATQTQSLNAAPPPTLAMEVATSVLYIEAALDDGDFDHPEHAARVRRLAVRLAAVRKGAQPEPLEPWMEELYRRVSDRQTMGSVVQELRASLGEVEKAIDTFFRKPEDHGVLLDVPPKLGAMRGVLSVLGMDHAAQALVRMRDEIDGLASTEVDPARVRSAGVFDRLAGNLSALGFLIDMLSVQPQLAKSLFTWNADSGTLAPVMGRTGPAGVPGADAGPVEPRLLEQAQLLAFTSVRQDIPLDEVRRDLERLSHEAQAADQPALAATVLKAQEAIVQAGHDEHAITTARGELSEALVDFVATSTEPAGLEPVAGPEPSAPVRPIVIVSDFEHDEEMRDIFLEEAREVIDAARMAIAELASAPQDLGLLTTVRRAFHTLKGSSRMVGLKSFGEAAWACEQVYNTQLAGQRGAEPALVDFTSKTLDELAAWVEDIAARRGAARSEGGIKLAADRVGRRLQSGESESDIALPIATTSTLPAGLPAAADLDLLAEPRPAPAAPAEVAFELNLSGLDPLDDPGTTAPPAWPGLEQPAANAMFDRFDSGDERAATDAPAFAASSFAALDLDLGAAADAEPFIRSLSPSSRGNDGHPARDTIAAPLDLSAAESMPSVMFSPTVIEAIDLDLGIAADGSARDAPGAGGAIREVDLAIEPIVEEHVKVVGPLKIGIALFNIFLNEADELSRRLSTALAEWSLELHQPIGESTIALAHSLAGNSATVGFTDLSQLARSLEHALARSSAIGYGTEDEARLFVDTADDIRRLLHQFAAGFLREPAAGLVARLAEHEASSALRLDAATAAAELAEERDGAATAEPEAAEPLITLDMGDQPAGFDSSAAVDAAATLEAAPAASSEDAVAVEAFAAVSDEPEQAIGVGTQEEVEPAAQDETAAPAAQDETAAPAAQDETVAPVEPVARVDAEPAATAGAPADAAPIGAAAPADADSEPEPKRRSRQAAAADAPVSTFGALAPIGSLGVAGLKPLPAAPSETARPAITARPSAYSDLVDDIDAVDAVDLELFPIFEEEAQELLPKLASQLRDWSRTPEARAHAAAGMRTLHTLKGGARLAGAMRLGEMAHRLETRIERLTAGDAAASAADVEGLQMRADAMANAFDALSRKDAQAYADAVAAAIAPMQPAADAAETAPPPKAPVVAASAPALPAPTPVLLRPLPAAPVTPPAATPQAASAELAETASPASAAKSLLRKGAAKNKDKGRALPRATPDPAGEPKPLVEAKAIDWSRFAAPTAGAVPVRPDKASSAAQSSVRVRAPLLDRLVNQAGEVSITRSRIETGVGQIRGSLGDLSENLERLRGQLRDLELQGEVQMTSRLEAAKAAAQSFDPLEFDRFTRFQELTRMMAESVNDVATVQRSLLRSIESAEDDLVAQARLTRDLQDDLLRTRMVEFEGLSDRLYRVVRLAAKETGKQVRLDIVGGGVEVDRGVLDRMTGAFEHLLRNGVGHGIESPERRAAAGKDPTGTIVVSLAQEGNEVSVEFRDDGAGLDMQKIRDKAVAAKLIDPSLPQDDQALANLIFTPGFSTAERVTELAGRGVGMDVVRSEIVAMGGRIETATTPGQGTSFRLILPLTTAVTQVVMLRAGENTIAVPSTLVEIVRRATLAEIDAAYRTGAYEYGGGAVPFFWLGALLQQAGRAADSSSRTRAVVVVRSAQQRVAIHVDEVLGNQEVVVKNLGPQLSRLPGLAGMTLLASGAVALIYNPVALATLYGDEARLSMLGTSGTTLSGAPLVPFADDVPPAAPLVLVVDDSLTVRRVTQRMLVREGYRVTLAKDGLDAIEKLADEVPQVVLSDIEMPRMDGFDLVRNLRADARWRDLPVIMITSRIAEKHREHARELGVDHYLGKPYSEEDLLALVGRYAGARLQAEAG